MAKQTTGYSQWFIMEVSRCAHDGWVLMMREQLCGCEPYYLYYKRGALRIAREQPEGFKLATGERVPGNVDERGLYAWIHRLATSLECLPE